MAVVFITRAPNRDMYNAVNAKVSANGPAPGIIVHTASDTPEGDVLIVDVWESREAQEAFGERLMAAFQDVGVAEMVAAGPQPQIYDTFDVIR